jgi:hypothetical protein
MLLYSTFIEELSKEYSIEIWAKSYVTNPLDWNIDHVIVKPFPDLKPLPHWLSYLRRINEYAWMYHLNANSLLINLKYKVKKTIILKILLILGIFIAKLKLNVFFENLIINLANIYERNSFLKQKLIDTANDYLLILNPFWVEEPLVAIEAKKLSIPVVSIIPSWDNITTKSRMLYQSDAYGVWSSIRINELAKYYPYTLKSKKIIIGTPQYDIFNNNKFILEKSEFYNQYGLNSDLPVLLYTIGSPLFINSEIEVCLKFCVKIAKLGFLDKFQVLIRPHPIKDFSEYLPKFKTIDNRIKIQIEVQTSKEQSHRFMNKKMLENWVSTFYYSDIVVATSSTTLLDAAMYNKPHINITGNLSDNKTYDSFIKDVSYGFIHLNELNNRKLLNNVETWNDFINQINEFIKNKSNFRNKSKEIVLHLCEILNDGEYGKLFAKKLIQYLKERC